MAKKRKDPVETGLQELIVKTLREAKGQDRGPGTEKLLAIARLLNTYSRLCRGESGGKLKPSQESMSPKEWREYCLEYGDPSYADEISK